jgi:hypothetical protein
MTRANVGIVLVHSMLLAQVLLLPLLELAGTPPVRIGPPRLLEESGVLLLLQMLLQRLLSGKFRAKKWDILLHKAVVLPRVNLKALMRERYS